MKAWTTGALALAATLAVLGCTLSPVVAGNPAEETIVLVGDGGEGCALGNWKMENVESHAWLGVHLQEITDGLHEALDLEDREGVLISDVVEDSPAEKAGLKPGDIIVKIDERNMRKSKDVVKCIGKKDPGDEVEVYYLRDGKEKSKRITLGEREADLPKVIRLKHRDIPGITSHFFPGGPRLGVVVEEMDQDLAEYFDVKEDEGVLVTRVIEDSGAEKAGIKGGDVIVQVEGEDVSSASDILEALSDFEDGDEVEVKIVRKGKTEDMKVEVEGGGMPNIFGRDQDFGHRIIMPDVDVLVDRVRDFDEWMDKDDLKKLKQEMQELKRELKELKNRMKEEM